MISVSPRASATSWTAASYWRRGTLSAALAATVVEAILLQQKKSFFTGGFLTATQAAGPGDSLLFLAVSVLVDASAIGLFAALILWATRSVRLSPTARLLLVTAGALAPIFVWDFITYSLLVYLGDAFDLGLMFDLTGRDTGEIMAVASAHMLAPAVLIALGGCGLAAVVWGTNRLSRAAKATLHVPLRIIGGALALLALGIVTSAVASGTSDTLEDGLRRKASGNTYTRFTAAVTDFDFDGFGIGGRTGDPAPFDSAVYPYALDVPDNGMDEDGVAGDLPVGDEYRENPPALTWRHRPTVVLIVLETFRADAMEATVDGRPVTPRLLELAQGGISSRRAFSHNGYTVESRQHLFSGSLAGLRDGTIVDDFKANGYEVAYFSGQDESFGGPEHGVGFDRADVAYDARQDRERRYTTFSTAGSLAVSFRTVEERIAAFLASRDRSKPLFLYVNFHDTHYPYHHKEMEALVSKTVVKQAQIGPAQQDALREMYLNAAANVDAAIGRTLDMVGRAVGSPPAVVVTADHGESLYEEGFLGHGYALNDVQTRIPLIVQGLPVRITEPFGQIDLRDAIGEALAQESLTAAPHATPAPGKVVFQYLGDITRPRQIAATTDEGRIIYDFRDNVVILPDGRSHRPNSLQGQDADRFRALVHQWERMMLARRTQH